MLSSPESLNDADKWQSETEKRKKLSSHVLVPQTSILEEVLGALLANTTSRRELARDCKTLDPWGTAARRPDHIVELKTSAK